MKRLLLIYGCVALCTVLCVLFIPGLSEYLSGKVLGWVSGAATS